MYQFGRLFRLTLSGESHGPAIVVSLDGVPAGLGLSSEFFSSSLAARRPCRAGETSRQELDTVEVLSGLHNGYTTGNPLTIMVRNNGHRSDDYTAFYNHPRPGHADYAMRMKWGSHADLRGGGMSSGRLTVGLVVAGAVARLLLPDVHVKAEVVELGGLARGWEEAVLAATSSGDSLGGVVSCSVRGLAAGVGAPFFDSLESLLSHGLFSIPGVKGVEFGSGFGMARMRGSECNDCYVSAEGGVSSNHNGGIAGGISTGAPLYLRVAFRPATSIALGQWTYDWGKGAMGELRITGRHDACYVRRTPIVVESVVLVVLADLLLQRVAEVGTVSP